MYSLMPFLLVLQGAPLPAHEPSLSVSVDSSRKEVTILAGPFDLPPGEADVGGMMGMMMHDDNPLPVFPMRWPSLSSAWVSTSVGSEIAGAISSK